MKILTTALFSVLLLKKSLSRSRWIALVLLSLGVGIVQIQAGKAHSSHSSHSAKEGMDAMKGFMAVSAACFTSGLAGVYFEMVLKNNKNSKTSSGAPTDLWTRNVQLSLFSLPPAIIPVLLKPSSGNFPSEITFGHLLSALSPQNLLHNFTPSAYFTVLIQTFGGLLTALVIKYSDNIVKGFATSLAIVISFLASVILFGFEMSVGFSLGAAVVLWATALYNRGEPARVSVPHTIMVDDDAHSKHSHSSSSSSGDWTDEKRLRSGFSSPRYASHPSSSYYDEERKRSFESEEHHPTFGRSTSPSGFASYSGGSSPVALSRSYPSLHQGVDLR
jgi:UDP-sugar transporter A1/2/3